MKTNSDEERLNAVLQTWVVDAPLPPRFQEGVWKRIARADELEQAHWWKRFVRLAMERPQVAYGYAAVLLAFGVLAGTVTAQMTSSRLQDGLGHRYVQSVDPFTQASLSR